MQLPDPNVCSPFSPWVCTVWKEGQGKASLPWSHSHRKHLLLNIWCGIKPIPGTQTQPFSLVSASQKIQEGVLGGGEVACGMWVAQQTQSGAAVSGIGGTLRGAVS